MAESTPRRSRITFSNAFVNVITAFVFLYLFVQLQNTYGLFNMFKGLIALSSCYIVAIVVFGSCSYFFSQPVWVNY